MDTCIGDMPKLHPARDAGISDLLLLIGCCSICSLSYLASDSCGVLTLADYCTPAWDLPDIASTPVSRHNVQALLLREWVMACGSLLVVTGVCRDLVSVRCA